MRGLRRIDRLVLLVLGPLWGVVFALAVVSVDRPVVALPYYLQPGEAPHTIRALPGWARPPAQPEDARPGDRLLAVAGEPVAEAGLLRVAALTWAAMDEDGVVPVELERGGRRLAGEAALREAAPRWPAVVVSLVFGLFAIGIILRAPRLRIAQVAFPASLSAALWLGGQFGRTPAEELAAFCVRMAAIGLALPLSVRALRWFPEGVPHTGAWTRGWPWLLALQALLAVNAELGLSRSVLLRSVVPQLVNGFFAVLVLAIATQNYRAARASGRRRFKWLLLGLYLGMLPPAFVGLLSAWDPAYGSWFIPSQLANLALPAVLLLGMWRQDLFDIDRVLNAALVYLTLGAVGLGLVVAWVPTAAGSLAERAGLDPDAARVLLDAAVLAMLVPVGLAAHGWLDRLVRREQRQREADLAALKAELAGADKVHEIAARVAQRLPALWGCEGAVVYAETFEGLAPVHAAGRTEAPPESEVPLARLAAGGAPWEDAHGRLWLPFSAGGRLLGAALLGPRRDGEAWRPADRAQLGSVADRAASRLVSLESAARLREARALSADLARERDAATRATREKSAFLATASHDLRQPLHALGLFLGALEGRTADPESRALLERVRASAGAMGQLFDALLDVTRLDAGVLEPRIEEGVELGPFLDALGRELAPLAAARGIRLRVAPTTLAAETDPRLLRSIVQNLAGNALRYAERGGVLLGARRRGDRVRIEVWDTGPGLSPREQDGVFEAWRRGEGAAQDGGVGLGLSIVQRLATLLGHPLHVASTPGRGSVFAVEVPRSRAAGREAGRAASVEPLPPARVLVIDDDPGARDGLGALLESWGLKVDTAADAEGAVRRVAARGVPAAILADLRLRGGRSGVEAIERVRAAANARIPACLITAETRERALVAGREAGLLVLFKPVEPVRLRAALAHLLRGAEGGPSGS